MLMIAAAFSAQAADWTFEWAHMYDSYPAAGDSPSKIKQLTDGNYVAMMMWGSRSDDTESGVFFDGTAVKDKNGQQITGGYYDTNLGNSLYQNLCIQKIDASTGEYLWTVYSDHGDFQAKHTSCDIEPTSDGGMLVLLQTRPWYSTDSATVLKVYDTTGEAYTITTDLTGHHMYKNIVMKLNADGEMQWIKNIIDYTLIEDRKYYPTELVTTYDLCSDDEENFYICGYFRSTMNFTTSDGTTKSISADNVASSWTGDVQTENGDMFLLKFDKDGNFLDCITDEGTATGSRMHKMVFHDGKLYISGYVNGTDGTNSLGGKTYEAPAYQSPMIASINTSDLSVNYVRVYASSSTGGVHNMGVQYMEGSVYILGSVQAKGNFTDNGTTILTTTQKLYRPTVFKVNPEDGSCEASWWSSKKAIGEASSIFMAVNETDTTYWVAHYDMTTGIAVTPLTLSGNTYTQGDQVTLVTFGTSAILPQCLLDGTSIVCFSRGGKANTTGVSASFYGTDTTLTNNYAWSVVLSKFSYADIVDTGISAVSTDVQVKKEGNNRIYNLQGQDVTGMSLNRGIYIKNGKKFVVK